MSQEQWRLLDKKELPQKGDECCVVRDIWSETGNAGIRQASGLIYRRKIEQPKPLVWSWGKADGNGIWAFGGHESTPKLVCARSVPSRLVDDIVDGWVCYLGPIPAIELPQKKYREPVLPADYGKVCEFSHDPNFSACEIDILCGYNKLKSGDDRPWRGLSKGYYAFARIEVTE